MEMSIPDHGRQDPLLQPDQELPSEAEKAGKGVRKFRLTLLFAVTAFVVIVAAAFITNYIIGNLAEDNLLRIAEENTARDAEQLYRVFTNLTMNAQDAMPDGGELTISTREVIGFAEVVFSDTGMGISDDEMGKIFEPLFTTRSKGTGLGLAICQHIVSKHSGTISVMSEPDQGATFVVRLPLNGVAS